MGMLQKQAVNYQAQVPVLESQLEQAHLQGFSPAPLQGSTLTAPNIPNPFFV